MVGKVGKVGKVGREGRQGGYQLESAVIAHPRWNSFHLLARFVKSFYGKDCICENQRRN
jgi:hypothetical protein